MNFQALPVVPSADELLDKALGKARKRAGQKRSGYQKLDAEIRPRMVAADRLRTTTETLIKDLEQITKSFPDFANLPDFYEEIAKSQLDLDATRQALGRVQGTATQLRSYQRNTIKELKSGAKTQGVTGRVSSMVKRLGDTLTKLEKTRRILTGFPSIKEDHYTVALAGFPNVGKSTLLSQLTPAKPKIANYAFTTKTLNTGYYTDEHHDIQVIDTPGTLSRFEKMNAIEQQAYLALKYVADLIVMIIDPTETYSLDEQERLLTDLKEHDKRIIHYCSKTDIARAEDIERVKEQHPDIITNITTLQEAIRKARKEADA